MNNYYIIQGVVDGNQIPTFILDADIQGIMSADHALRIAHDIVGKDKKVCLSAWHSGYGFDNDNWAKSMN